jgi:hypothetical protein
LADLASAATGIAAMRRLETSPEASMERRLIKYFAELPDFFVM